jgi:hypothetical protein
MKLILGVAAVALLSVVACDSASPTLTGLLAEEALLAKGGGSQTQYGFTFAGGLASDPAHPFSAAAKTGDPFYGGVSGNPVYLTLPASAGGNASVCNQDGSGQLPSIGDWGAYAGVWKGDFSIGAKGQGPSYHLAFNATREDGTGWIWLVVNGTGVKSSNKLTLTFTNVWGLVGAGSTPTGAQGVGPFDSTDRCLTFSITATP